MYRYVFISFSHSFCNSSCSIHRIIHCIQIHRVYLSCTFTMDVRTNDQPIADDGPINAEHDCSDSGAGSSGSADGRAGVFVVSPPPPNHVHADEHRPCRTGRRWMPDSGISLLLLSPPPPPPRSVGQEGTRHPGPLASTSALVSVVLRSLRASGSDSASTICSGRVNVLQLKRGGVERKVEWN